MNVYHGFIFCDIQARPPVSVLTLSTSATFRNMCLSKLAIQQLMSSLKKEMFSNDRNAESQSEYGGGYIQKLIIRFLTYSCHERRSTLIQCAYYTLVDNNTRS
jgi:hypothetical protein